MFSKTSGYLIFLIFWRAFQWYPSFSLKMSLEFSKIKGFCLGKIKIAKEGVFPEWEFRGNFPVLPIFGVT